MMELEVSKRFSWKILKTDILNGASPFNSNSKGVQRQQSRIIESQAESEPFFCFWTTENMRRWWAEMHFG